MISLHPVDADRPTEDDNQGGTRLFINPQQLTKVQADPQRSLKVWLNDEAVYIGIIPSGRRIGLSPTPRTDPPPSQI